MTPRCLQMTGLDLYIDRGGLKYVSDMTYMVFLSMKQKYVNIYKSARCHKILKERPSNNRLKSTQMFFFFVTGAYIIIVSTEWENTTTSTLLDVIVALWVTIRGFSGASGWLEKYKQMNKRTVQKSKGVRKQLVSTTTK